MSQSFANTQELEKYIIHGPSNKKKNLSEGIIQLSHRWRKINKNKQLKKLREEISGN